MASAILAAPALDPFYRLVRLDETASTNDDARKLIGEGAPEGTLVWAERQTAGRGRRGRRWESPAGNLFLSLILRPNAPQAQIGQIGFAAALAVAESVASFLPARRIACKWPNDVLVETRKISGLLLEAEPGALILGVGVNVASHPDGVEYPATSLAAEGARADAGAMLGAFAASFLPWYRRWTAEGFAPLREAWLARVAGLGGPIRVRLERETLDGVFGGLDDEGSLLLHRPGAAPFRVTAGDVFFPESA